MLKIPLHTRRGAPRSRTSKGNPSSAEIPRDWEARHLPRGKAVLEWMGAAPPSGRTAIEGYFVDTGGGARAAKVGDAPALLAGGTPECLPEPDIVYEGPIPPTGWDDWNAKLDGIVDRAERLRKLAHETRHRADERLASMRAFLRTGWRFAESFVTRLHLSPSVEPRGRRPATTGKKHSEH